MHRKLNALLVIAILALTLGATWLIDGQTRVTPAKPAQPERPASSGPVAPDITLTDLQGKTVKLHDFKGKTVLLNFWATWCTPCIAEFPQFVRLAQSMPDDLVILAVSIDEDPKVIPAFMKRYVPEHTKTKNLKLFSDADKSISQDVFQTIHVPETIILTPEMMMARKVAGLSIEWDSGETKKYLASLPAD